MGRVRSFSSVDSPRNDDSYRRLSILHGPDLHGGGVRAEKQVIREVKGIPIVSSGMMRREVQRFEIVVIRLDLRPLFDRKTHRDKNILNFLLEEDDGMRGPPVFLFSRQSEVNFLLDRFGSRELFLGRFEFFLDVALQSVDDLAGFRFFFGF